MNFVGIITNSLVRAKRDFLSNAYWLIIEFDENEYVLGCLSFIYEFTEILPEASAWTIETVMSIMR